jgi:hypothetical protein
LLVAVAVAVDDEFDACKILAMAAEDVVVGVVVVLAGAYEIGLVGAFSTLGRVH